MLASLTWTAPASDLKKTADHPVCHMVGFFFCAKTFSTNKGTQIETRWSFVGPG